MWQKLAQIALTYLIEPLIKKGILAIVNWAKATYRKWKLKKDNDKKVKNYEQSSNKDDARDSFSDMP